MRRFGMMSKTYEEAIHILNSRRRVARPTNASLKDSKTLPKPADPQAVQTSTPKSDLKGTPSLVGMKEWLEILGHTDKDLRALPVIHVAGTKGKGSTCAYIRSLLLAHSTRTQTPFKVGLYTSPDLRNLPERIQINNSPISSALFTTYFHEVNDAISQSSYSRKPRFLQLVFLTAVHTFIKEKMDAVIVECHHGGEYDATNVLPSPVVSVVTKIGEDHMAQLGPAVEDVAWHKSGIYKEGAAAVAGPQEGNVMEVLRRRAEEKGAERFVPVEVDESLPVGVEVQKVNCSVAVRVVDEFLKKTGREGLSKEDVEEGIKGFQWPGRFEIIDQGKNKWYLDGAHNELSLEIAAKWFVDSTAEEKSITPGTKFILIFSHISTERDARSVFEALAKALHRLNRPIDHLIFTTLQERRDGSLQLGQTSKVGKNQDVANLMQVFPEVWRELDERTEILARQSVEEGIELAKELAGEGGMRTFIAGSLHLVGGALNVLKPLE